MLQASMRLNAFYRAMLDASLSHVYLVRWHDEDEGWRSMQVIARSKQEARDAAAMMTTCPVEVYDSAV